MRKPKLAFSKENTDRIRAYLQSENYLKEQMEKYFFASDDLDSIQGYTPK